MNKKKTLIELSLFYLKDAFYNNGKTLIY